MAAVVGSASATPLTDKDHFRVLQVDDTTWILHEKFTGEKVALPGPGPWSLHFGDDGAYVNMPGRDSLWVDDLTRYCAFEEVENSGEVHVMLEDDSVVTLASFQQRHHPMKAPIPVDGIGAPVEARAYVLYQEVAGCYCLWGLESLYKAVIGDGFLFSRFYQSWWPWWEKSMTALGFVAADHFRRSMPTAQSGTGETPLQDGDGRRFLLEPTMSSYALTLVCCRGAAPSRGSSKKNPVMMQSWRNILNGVFKKYVDSTTVPLCWSVYVDDDAPVEFGLPLRGRHRVDLLITNGTVRFEALVAHAAVLGLIKLTCVTLAIRALVGAYVFSHKTLFSKFGM